MSKATVIFNRPNDGSIIIISTLRYVFTIKRQWISPRHLLGNCKCFVEPPFLLCSPRFLSATVCQIRLNCWLAYYACVHVRSLPGPMWRRTCLLTWHELAAIIVHARRWQCLSSFGNSTESCIVRSILNQTSTCKSTSLYPKLWVPGKGNSHFSFITSWPVLRTFVTTVKLEREELQTLPLPGCFSLENFNGKHKGSGEMATRQTPDA